MTLPPDAPENPTSYVPVSADHSRWVRSAVLLGLLAFAAIFLFVDFGELRRTLARADPRLLPLPVLCVGLSYLTMALSYQGISRAAGANIPFLEMLKITCVANTLNYIIATGGLSGFAARMFYFTRLGIPANTAVVISLAQTFMTNVTLLGFVLGGFVYVVTTQPMQRPTLALAAIVLTILLAAVFLIAFLLLHPRIRRRTLFCLAQATYAVLHRLQSRWTPQRTHIWRYQFNLNRGITFLLSRKRHMLAPLIYIILDWLLTILILHTAFLAMRYDIRFSETVVGFAVGITLSFLSFVPGGLGVMEGSMAGVFKQLGVPFETAVVAVLLFRLIYYILPLLVSLFFLHGMLTLARQAAERGKLGSAP